MLRKKKECRTRDMITIPINKIQYETMSIKMSFVYFIRYSNRNFHQFLNHCCVSNTSKTWDEHNWALGKLYSQRKLNLSQCRHTKNEKFGSEKCRQFNQSCLSIDSCCCDNNRNKNRANEKRQRIEEREKPAIEINTKSW